MKWTGMAVLLLASLPLLASDPAWIYGQGHEEYQGDRYLTALGEGSTSEDARKNAFSRLAEQLKVSIASESNIVKDYQSSADQFQQSENVNIQIQTRVDLENIEGIKIVSRHHKPDSDTYYAFAVLDKVKNATDLAFRIEGQFAQVRDQLQQARDRINAGRVSEGFNALIQAGNKLEPIAQDIELHKLFARSGANSLLRDNALQLLGEVDQYLAKVFRQVSVTPAGDNRKAGSPEVGVSDPFRVRFSYAGSALQRVPATVITDMQGATLDHDDTTSSDGSLVVHVRSFPYTGKQENKLRVKLGINDELFLNKSPYTELVVLLSQKQNVSVQLKTRVKSPSHDYLDVVINEGLASILSEQNYNVIDGDGGSSAVDYVIEVRGSVADYPGFSGMNFAKISGVILIKSGRSGRTLKTLKIKSEATKAGALSSDSAAEKSAALLSRIVRDDLLDTLEKNLGRN